MLHRPPVYMQILPTSKKHLLNLLIKMAKRFCCSERSKHAQGARALLGRAQELIAVFGACSGRAWYARADPSIAQSSELVSKMLMIRGLPRADQ